MRAIVSGCGFPTHWQMSSSWCCESEPGQRGLRPRSSARMHPTAHMSTALVYSTQPVMISGARYHRVAT